MGDISKYAYIEYLKDRLNSGEYIGFLCSYVPPEIVYSAGFEPLPLVFSSFYPEKTDEIYPKYFCPYIKNTNEFLLRNDIHLEKIVITDGCDSSKRIYECWKELKISSDIHFLKIPFSRDNLAIRFFADELRKLYIDLLGYEDRERLVKTIKFYNDLRDTLRNFKDKDVFSYLYFLMGKTFEEKEQKFEESFSPNLKIYLLGSMIPLEFFSYLKDMNIEISYLDSCFGDKNLEIIEEYNNDPYISLSFHYLMKVNCVRSFLQDDRVERIVNKSKEIDGVIVYSLKYCDPLLFQIGRFIKVLKEMRIPVLIIEDDYTMGNKEQIRTRLEAFMEMVYENRKNCL